MKEQSHSSVSSLVWKRLRVGTGECCAGCDVTLQGVEIDLCLHCLCATPVLCCVQCTACPCVQVPEQHIGVARTGTFFLRCGFVMMGEFGKSRAQLQSRVKCTP